MSALTRQLSAMCRVLIDSGDMTPMAKRQIENVLKQHADDQAVPSTQISELARHLNHWESKQHTAVGISFLRNHFGLRTEPNQENA